MFRGFTYASLFMADLKLCTQRSARPLLAGWYGAHVRCLIPFLLKNIWFSLRSWCPFSLFPNTQNGHPQQSKTCSQEKVWQNQYGFAARVTMAIPQVQYQVQPNAGQKHHRKQASSRRARWLNVSFVMDDHLQGWQYSRTKEKTTMCHTTLGAIAGLQNQSQPGVNSMVNNLSTLCVCCYKNCTSFGNLTGKAVINGILFQLDLQSGTKVVDTLV